MIQTYTNNTGGYRSNTILEVWRVSRENEVIKIIESNKNLVNVTLIFFH